MPPTPGMDEPRHAQQQRPLFALNAKEPKRAVALMDGGARDSRNYDGPRSDTQKEKGKKKGKERSTRVIMTRARRRGPSTLATISPNTIRLQAQSTRTRAHKKKCGCSSAQIQPRTRAHCEWTRRGRIRSFVVILCPLLEGGSLRRMFAKELKEGEREKIENRPGHQSTYSCHSLYQSAVPCPHPQQSDGRHGGGGPPRSL